jgi:hypothetical protein
MLCQFFYSYAKRRYAERHYVDCRGAHKHYCITSLSVPYNDRLSSSFARKHFVFYKFAKESITKKVLH